MLIVARASGQEVVPDVEANERQRILGQPVLLKHMLVQDFLPSLVTILHSVPKLRNALLNSESHLYDYGFNSQWWSGESIQTPTISYTDDTSTTENTSSACPPIVAEVQRLMAFLDKSERAYGSAEALSRVHAIKVYEQTSALPKPLMERFVETWDSIGDSQSLFLSTITDLKQSSAATRDLHMFEARTGFAAPEKDIALVDVLDNCFWDVQDNGDFEPDHFLDEVAPVQILTIRPHKTWNLLVPPEIFLDRYLLSNSDIIQQMKNKKSTYVQQIDKVNSTLKKLETYKYNSSTGTGLVSAKEGNAVRLMEDSIKFLQDRSQEAKDDEVKNQTRLTIAKLEKISARVEEKIQALKAEKEEAQTAMKKFSAILTDPSTPPQPSDYEFECRYVLRGVATASPRTLTTYASYAPPRRTSAQDASVQWWKLCYDTTGPTPRLEKSSVSQDEVLAEAGKGAQDTMLVYTSSAMLSGPPPVPLPPQLERFVEKDNAAFREELEQSDPFNVPDGPGPAVPITLTGVRTRSSSRGSDDSMTVNRDDEGIEMDERDLPPPYDGSEKELEDVKMEPQPEMEERNGHGRPGLFDMPHKGIPGSDTEMEGP